MSYNPSIPLNSDSPSNFPAQSQANFGRLKTIIEADHQFNLSATGNDGYHNLIHMTIQAPSGALASTGRLYVKSSGGQVNIFYMNDAGTEYQLSPGMPIRAAVNFDGTLAVGAQMMRSSFNVSSVSKTATGLYTITYTTPMANTDYIALVTGMRYPGVDSGNEVFSYIVGSNTLTDSYGLNDLKIGFQNSSGSRKDVIVGNVTILSVT